jgi:hypothetical protein
MSMHYLTAGVYKISVISEYKPSLETNSLYSMSMRVQVSHITHTVQVYCSDFCCNHEVQMIWEWRIHTEGGLLRGRWWPVGPKLVVFDQMAAPVPGIIDTSGSSGIATSTGLSEGPLGDKSCKGVVWVLGVTGSCLLRSIQQHNTTYVWIQWSVTCFHRSSLIIHTFSMRAIRFNQSAYNSKERVNESNFLLKQLTLHKPGGWARRQTSKKMVGLSWRSEFNVH